MTSGQRRTALVSILAALVLVALKLGTGLATGSLALTSAGIESSGDVIAALLTLFAVRLGARPADSDHPYGHRRAENLAALGEAAIIGLGGLIAAYEAFRRLFSGEGAPFSADWYLFAVLGVALAIDLARIAISLRAARRYRSPAFRSNAFNFAGDLAGTLAALAGIALVAAGFEQGDSIAALVVAALIFLAVGRLVLENGRVLMDTAPPDAQRQAEAAISALRPEVELRQLRLRESGGKYFADAVVAAPPEQALVESHGIADRVEEAVGRALPDTEVVVHLEPQREGLSLRARAASVALAEPLVQEAHDIAVYYEGERAAISMHLKLEAETPLAAAHEVAERIEATLLGADEVSDIQTHIEPLEEPLETTAASAAHEAEVAELVRARTGSPPRHLRVRESPAGLLVFVDVVCSATETVAVAHGTAHRLEEEIREALPQVADVIVHTEP